MDRISKRRGNPAWQSGISGNPAGRPKRGISLAERVRELVDTDAVIEFLDSVWRDPTAKLETRVAAAREILDRGHGRAVQALELDATLTAVAAPLALPDDWDQMPAADKEQLLASLPMALPRVGS